jgi:hypothetical protein
MRDHRAPLLLRQDSREARHRRAADARRHGPEQRLRRIAEGESAVAETARRAVEFRDALAVAGLAVAGRAVEQVELLAAERLGSCRAATVDIVAARGRFDIAAGGQCRQHGDRGQDGTEHRDRIGAQRGEGRQAAVRLPA